MSEAILQRKMDQSETLYLLSHEHTPELLGDPLHENCREVSCRRLYGTEVTRYMFSEPLHVKMLYSTNYQFRALTHIHEPDMERNAHHQWCRPVMCRKLYENAEVRYLPGASDLQVTGDQGDLHPV
jgi:hypothetical protein